ncbi:MAG: SemiSWEET transporter [Fibrobacter sp.]|jgi:MtN3 and saliva related transmembrane protein|nr:SemiSWEET transporter [Fibrobacter sp.]HON11468.1 SemiSWEET transporter [Chitinispirillaceae bacterium]
MKIEMLIGLMGGTLTTISFVPQVLRVWKTRSARDLSFTMFLLFAIGVLLWLIYGIILGEWPVILANSVTLVFAIIILIFKIKYK